MFVEEMCTINGLSCGRPLVVKMDAVAEAERAFAARPYTVSVGKTTSEEDLRI